MEPLGTNVTDILIEIHTFSVKKNTLENIVGEKVPILPWPQFAK